MPTFFRHLEGFLYVILGADVDIVLRSSAILAREGITPVDGADELYRFLARVDRVRTTGAASSRGEIVGADPFRRTRANQDNPHQHGIESHST